MKTQAVNSGSHTTNQEEARVQTTRCQVGSGRHGSLKFKLSVGGGSEGSVFLKLMMYLRRMLTQYTSTLTLSKGFSQIFK